MDGIREGSACPNMPSPSTVCQDDGPGDPARGPGLDHPDRGSDLPRMRRPLAILALAATSWSQVAALHCEMDAPVTSASPTADAHARHAGHGVPTGARHHAGRDAPRRPASDARHQPRSGVHGHQGPEGADQTCRSAMACGTVMAEPIREAGAIELPAPSPPARTPLAVAISTVPATADPPPPRTLV